MIAMVGIIVRPLVYLVLYYSFAQPRAVAWRMYLVSIAIMYCCNGIGYLLSLVGQGIGCKGVCFVLPSQVPAHVISVPLTGCHGLLSRQMLDGPASQLCAAVGALINTLIAGKHAWGGDRGLLGLAYNLSFARWGLEGYIIAEADRLSGGSLSSIAAGFADQRDISVCGGLLAQAVRHRKMLAQWSFMKS